MHCCYNSTKGQRESGDSEFKLTAKFKSFSFYLLSLSSYRNQGACYLEQLCQRKNKVIVFYLLCVFGWRLDQTYSFSMRLAEASADKKGVTK